jgi:hypothetical protein
MMAVGIKAACLTNIHQHHQQKGMQLNDVSSR